MPNAVEHIAIPEQTIAYLAVHGSVRETQEPFARLFAALAEAGVSPAGPPMARFDLNLSDPDDADYEVAVPIALDPGTKLPDNAAHVRAGTLPAHYALVTVHEGPYEEIGAGYTALTEELDSLGYGVAGPASEVYLVGADSGVESADFVTEVRLPVES
ncbi:MAG TPA: GyrI-like domain-containing protein [Thermoleophilia bacterium]|nr:GyrI-like domain-containing protein [Thermoleophilia bacterium]